MKTLVYIAGLVLFASGVKVCAERLDLPTGYALHAYNDSYIDEKDFGNYSAFFRILPEQKAMGFNLPEGTVNTYDSAGVRVEAFTPKPWTSNDENIWYAWAGTYRIDRLGAEGRGYAIFQMKSLDTAVQWEVAINIDTGENVILNHRRSADQVLGTDLVGKPFRIKVASNGRKYKVWHNGVLQAEKAHQMDPSGDSAYAWRWGIYKGGFGKTTSKETTRITMINIQYGLSDAEGNLFMRRRLTWGIDGRRYA